MASVKLKLLLLRLVDYFSISTESTVQMEM
jgi:hypothetical protein